MKKDVPKIGHEELAWLGRAFRLGDVPAFDLRDLTAGLPGLELLKLPPHTTVVREGDPGDDLFVLQEGEVSVNKKKGHFGAVEVVRLGAGDYFGEVALLGRPCRSATVTTEKDCRVFKIRAEEFRRLLDAKPALAAHLRKVAEARLAKLAEVDK